MTRDVYILDSGSLVIDRSQVLWHIDVGTPVRFPVHSVLPAYADGYLVDLEQLLAEARVPDLWGPNKSVDRFVDCAQS